MAKREFAQLAHSYDPVKPFSFQGWLASRKLNGWGCLWDGGVTRGIPAYKVPWYYIGGDDRLRTQPIATGLWTIGRSDKYGIKPKTIQAPDWFLDLLPVGIPLQGEIWCNDDLQAVKSICGGSSPEKKKSKRWEEVKFVVYNTKPYCLWFEDTLTKHVTSCDVEKNIFEVAQNCPDVLKNNGSFSKRMVQVSQKIATPILSDLTSTGYNVGDLKEKVFVLPQKVIEDQFELEGALRVAKKRGWEGIMLINPKAPYECARTHNLLKIKPEFDAEAKVVGYVDGTTGKNIGKLGAVRCRMTWGESVFSVTGGRPDMIDKTVMFCVSGWSDEEREWSWIKENYPIGSELKFTFSGVSVHGVPCSCNVSRL